MCYSSMAEESLRKVARHGETEKIRLDAFNELLRLDHEQLNDKPRDIPLRWPKAMEANFYNPRTPEEHETAALFETLRAAKRSKLEAGLFRQRARLVAAERTLATKEARKALEERRIATNKVEWHRLQLSNLDRKDLRPSDSRIYPFWYTLVIAVVDGERVVMPMRYHCRQNGKPASIDKKYDGLYNARRDNLDGYWKNVWTRRHAVMVAWAFYENVTLEAFEHRALAPGEKSQNLVLEFKPQAAEPMLLACLWDKWEAPGEQPLYSFAAITDEPPPEIAATGHDRCPIPLKPEHLDDWLSPEGRSKEELQAILDDRERPRYEHRKAA